MDWARAIEINRDALIRIVAALVALLGLQTADLRVAAPFRLPLPVYLIVSRALLPAEAAVRRLIVIVMRKAMPGFAPKPVPVRPMPKGLTIARKGGGRMVFQLFDARKDFADADDAARGARTGPRIRGLDERSPQAQFLARFAVPGSCSEAAARKLHCRLAAIAAALDDLAHQARRMMRWQARRAALARPVFTSPMRPGPPPGHRKKPRDEIDDVLRECHALAWDALTLNTS